MKKKMNLSDNDKREIIQLIQENKPIPDKYRFLLFQNKDEIELLWNGKSREVEKISLPFQIIEHVDVPREEKEIKLQGNLFDESGRQLIGWTNKLIWGNNNLILSSLLNGPLYQEIQEQGGLKLVYIDPPFDTGDDFNFEIKIGKEDFEKKRNFLEEIAYRDTWRKGSDSFISMISERLRLIHKLLSDDASIFVHCDWRVSAYMKLILDEIFGSNNFINEIIWKRQTSSGYKGGNKLGKNHDTIYFYSKSENYKFNNLFTPYSEKYIEDQYDKKDAEGRIYRTHWIGTKTTKETISKFLESGRIVKREDGKLEKRLYLDEQPGIALDTIWNDITALTHAGKERLGYPTQKPEALLERIIKLTTDENDLIADFFCGSGTTLAVAEKMGRKWIGCDLGKFAIHTSRKRLLNVQRENKINSKNWRAFEILNLGKYQRESFISNISSENSYNENHYIDLILKAYNAEKINNPILHGVKNSRYVYVGPINLHVSRIAVETVVNECFKNKITKVDILCFEHEQGLFPNIINESKEKGVDVSCKIIPFNVFDKIAIEKNQVIFHDVAFIEFKPIIKKNKLSIELTGFSVDYSQNKIDEALSEIKNNKSKVILNNGQIIKISRDKNGIEHKEILTKSWKDWIDYWAVDFNFESKKETFKKKNEKGIYEYIWTRDFIFQNEWQSFRSTSGDIDFISAEKEFFEKKSIKIAVKVVDIFGNDTMKVLKVNL
jgi:DNA modification methylase